VTVLLAVALTSPSFLDSLVLRCVVTSCCLIALPRSIVGDGCNLEVLGTLSEATGGSVINVNPLELTKNFSSILAKAVLASNVSVKLLLHFGMQFRNEAGVTGNKLTREVGNVTDDTEVGVASPGVLCPLCATRAARAARAACVRRVTRARAVTCVRAVTYVRRVTGGLLAVLPLAVLVRVQREAAVGAAAWRAGRTHGAAVPGADPLHPPRWHEVHPMHHPLPGASLTISLPCRSLARGAAKCVFVLVAFVSVCLSVCDLSLSRTALSFAFVSQPCLRSVAVAARHRGPCGGGGHAGGPCDREPCAAAVRKDGTERRVPAEPRQRHGVQRAHVYVATVH
jgi:hypothetical protein